MQEDAIEVVARLLGRDGKFGAVDEPFELARLEREIVRQLATAISG